MFKIPQPDGVLSAGDVKEVAADVIGELPLPGIEGSPLDSGDIWPVENLWLVLRWAVVARPRRGGRDLPTQFTFSTFCDWIRHVLEQDLERRWEIEMNGTGVPDAYGSAAG